MAVENGGEVGSWGRPYVRFRRRRKYQGSDIDEHLAPTVTTKDKGLLCRNCGHWKPWKKIDIVWSTHNGTICRRWVCKDCSNDLKEDEL